MAQPLPLLAQPLAFPVVEEMAGSASRYGASRQWNWRAIGGAVALEALLLAAVIQMGIFPVNRTIREEPVVMKLIPITPPPQAQSQPTPPDMPEKPVVKPEVNTPVVAPKPEVVLRPTPSPISTAIEAPAPQPSPVESRAPSPVAAPAAPGPVNVTNLGTNIINGAAPRYPMEARTKREQGVVVLRLMLSEQGRVTDISVHKSSGFPSLDKAAVDAVRRWRWSPLIRDGKAVAITGLVQIPFVLKNE
ncbi:MAG TPA: energy transducer TonB [Sphingobium sp.]